MSGTGSADGREEGAIQGEASGAADPAGGGPADMTAPRRPSPSWVFLVAVLAVAVGALAGAWMTVAFQPKPHATVEAFDPNVPTLDTPAESEIKTVIAHVMPAVATVSASATSGGGTGQVVATGIVVGSDGEVLTNDHVVYGAGEVTVALAGSASPRAAEIVATDATDDLALLRVPGVHGLDAATFATSVQDGQPVLAVGDALDPGGQQSVTHGIVSASGRTVHPSDVGNGIPDALTNMIQTDAAFAAGTSGGPLVNMSGQVIGVCTAIAVSSAGNAPAENINYAIPSSTVRTVLPQLQAGRHIGATNAYLGVDLTDLTPQWRTYFGIGAEPASGAVVQSVVANAPADQAGVQVGDVVTELAGQAVTSVADVASVLLGLQPGENISLVVYRLGQPITLTLVVGTKPLGGLSGG